MPGKQLPGNECSNVSMTGIAIDLHERIKAALPDNMLLKGPFLFSFIVKQSQYSSPLTHIENRCEVAGETGHTLLVLFIRLNRSLGHADMRNNALFHNR